MKKWEYNYGSEHSYGLGYNFGNIWYNEKNIHLMIDLFHKTRRASCYGFYLLFQLHLLPHLRNLISQSSYVHSMHFSFTLLSSLPYLAKLQIPTTSQIYLKHPLLEPENWFNTLLVTETKVTGLVLGTSPGITADKPINKTTNNYNAVCYVPGCQGAVAAEAAYTITMCYFYQFFLY